MLALFGCSDGGGGGGGGGSTGSASYTTTDAATSVSLTVPEGAYDPAKPQPKFTVAKNVAPLPAGNPIAANGGAAGDVFVITTDYADDFMQPVEVTVPYTPGAANALPTVVYYDSVNNVYVPVDVLNIGANTVTFSTVHFSTYVPATHSGIGASTVDISSFAVDSGFVPNEDGFDVANFGNFVSPDGSGLGMANFAAWYYSYKTLKGQPQLYNKYTPTVERALIASVQSSASNIWKRAWNSSNNSLNNKQVGMLMLLNMKLTNLPQIFVLKSVDANNKTDFAHVTLAYKFVPSGADGGTFYLYDPNFPGEVVTINFSLTNGFTGYSKAGAFSQTFTKYLYSSPSNIGSYRQFQAAYQAAENGLGSIALTAPTVNASDAASITVTSTALPDVTVTGSVSSAPSMQQMYYTLNGGTAVALGSSSNFSFTLPGAQLTNPSTVAIYGLSNAANPWSVVAYRQITINFTGTTITSFGNIGFESADMSSWTIETRLDNQLVPYAYDMGTVIGLMNDINKSPFAKISATTTDSAWTYPGYSACPGGFSDGKGHCYDANGTVNPDYDPYWGMLTAFNGTPYTPGKSAITQRTDTDIYVGTLFPLANNGNYSLRINNFDDSYHVSTATQTATIPAVALPTLKFAWAAVLEDAGHSIPEQPYVQVMVKDMTANKILYYKRFANNDPTYSGWIKSVNYSSWSMIPWQSVVLDVSNSKGNQVMIQVTGGDCTQGGHGGYVYLDDSP